MVSEGNLVHMDWVKRELETVILLLQFRLLCTLSYRSTELIAEDKGGSVGKHDNSAPEQFPLL